MAKGKNKKIFRPLRIEGVGSSPKATTRFGLPFHKPVTVALPHRPSNGQTSSHILDAPQVFDVLPQKETGCVELHDPSLLRLDSDIQHMLRSSDPTLIPLVDAAASAVKLPVHVIALPVPASTSSNGSKTSQHHIPNTSPPGHGINAPSSDQVHDPPSAHAPNVEVNKS